LTAGPRQQLLVAAAVGGERRGGDRPANLIEHRGDVQVDVGVDAKGDGRLVV
jgi:hypothetical protein